MLIKCLVYLINFIIYSLCKIGAIALTFLPDSPFLMIENSNLPFIETLNWVIPIDFMLTLLGHWVLAIGIYYLVQVILRWVKVIE